MTVGEAKTEPGSRSRDPPGEVEVPPVAFDMAESGGFEEVDVPGGGDGDKDALQGQALAVHLLAGIDVVGPHRARE